MSESQNAHDFIVSCIIHIHGSVVEHLYLEFLNNGAFTLHTGYLLILYSDQNDLVILYNSYPWNKYCIHMLLDVRFYKPNRTQLAFDNLEPPPAHSFPHLFRQHRSKLPDCIRYQFSKYS